MCMNLMMEGRLINPRWVQVYAEESMIGRITRIWSRSAQGPYQRTVQYVFFDEVLSSFCCGDGPVICQKYSSRIIKNKTNSRAVRICFAHLQSQQNSCFL